MHGINLNKMQEVKSQTSLLSQSKQNNCQSVFKPIFSLLTSVNPMNMKSITSDRHWISQEHISKETNSCLNSTITKIKKVKSSLCIILMKNQEWIIQLNCLKKDMITSSYSMEGLKDLDRRFRMGWREKMYLSSKRRRKLENSRNKDLDDCPDHNHLLHLFLCF